MELLEENKLENKKTILRFGPPRHLPSSIDGIEIYFPYEIVSSSKEKFKLLKEEKVGKGIKVSISGSLAITWGFQIWQPSENYFDLMKLLLPYAINEIKHKLEEGTLNDFEEIVLLTSTHPQEREYDINELAEVDGYEEEILRGETNTKTISEQISINQLAGDIIQYRDLINALVYNKHDEKLLELDQERNLLEFFKTAYSNEDFSHRIASLGGLIGKMNKRLLKALSNESDNSFGTIALLEKFVINIGGKDSEITIPLRQINRLRQAYPIHTDKAKGVIEAHGYFDLDYPINDYEQAWETVLDRYLKSLKNLFELLKSELMKK